MISLPIELLKAVYLISFSLGCWTCLSILVTKKSETKTKFILLLFVCFLMVPPINAYFNLLTQGKAPWLMLLNQNLAWAYGPLLFFMVKHVTLKTPSYIEFFIHLIPFLTTLIIRSLNINIPLFNSFYFTLLFTQIFCYITFSLFFIKLNQTGLKRLIFHHPNTSYYWLLFLISGLLLITFFDIIVISLFNFGFFPDLALVSIIACAFSLYISGIALFIVYQPVIFTESPTLKKTSEDPKPTLRNIELTPKSVSEICDRLDTLIETHPPHLDEEISLSKLASQLDITASQLSEYFNVHKNTSFYDFLNHLRYEESIKLLLQKDTDLTVADIAYQAGFNNRNTFYKTFKQKTGFTPSEFRKANVKTRAVV